MFYIGSYRIDSRAVLAPMAGITDAPFRRICQGFGAGTTTSEMLTAKTELWNSRKSSLRLLETAGLVGPKNKDNKPRVVQIAGSEPEQLARAAAACADAGVQIVDINMGCPAKKVCNKAAGSALLRDEQLVQRIISRVVRAIDIPVTLKIRTGWCPRSRNGERIARIAQDAGIAALTVHGRTRACRFGGEAEYDTIAAIVAAVTIPVIANGDIDSPQKALAVLERTGAQAVMVGRAARGRPWIFQAIDSYLKSPSQLRKGRPQPEISLMLAADVISEHLVALYRHYGDHLGPRIARKHLKWYLVELARDLSLGDFSHDLQIFNKIDSSYQQHRSVRSFFEKLLFEQNEAQQKRFERHQNKEDKAA